MRKIEINIERASHHYDILLDPGLCREWRAVVSERLPASRYLALMDDNLARLRGLPEHGTVDGKWRYLRVRPGEENKSLAQYAELCDQVLGNDIDRHTVVAAIGGGVSGDLAGFMASTLLRGLRLVQIPTTLLAQVDSSVGGKNGVNTGVGKNMIGTFHQPDLVLIDPEFLETLPPREYRAGLAEIVKTGVLAGRDLFDPLRRSADRLLAKDSLFLNDVIARCCRFKADVVEADERDLGRRYLLNLGHTFGHALEALAGYDGRVVHGEAVAAGMALAAAFSRERGYLSVGEEEEIVALAAALGLPVRIGDLGGEADHPPKWKKLLAGDALAGALLNDKKNATGRITVVLPHAIGDCRVEKGYDVGEIAAFMRERV